MVAIIVISIFIYLMWIVITDPSPQIAIGDDPIMKTWYKRYRIVYRTQKTTLSRQVYIRYDIHVFRIWFPFWCDFNTYVYDTVDEAKKAIQLSQTIII